MAIDHLKAANVSLGHYFGADEERRQKCLLLAKHSVWTTNYRMLPPTNALDLAREVFPSLEQHLEMVYGLPRDGLVASRIPTALLERNDPEGAAAYLAAAVVSKEGYVLNEDNVEGANEMLLQLATHFTQILTFISSDIWGPSAERQHLQAVIKSLGPIFDITGEHAVAAVLTPSIATRVFNHGDIDLFEEMLDNPHFRLPNPGAFVVDLGDMWGPAKVGNLSLQKRLLSHVETDMGKFTGPTRVKATLGFWRGVTSHLDALDLSSRKEDWQEIFRLATKTFNFDSFPNGKEILKTKQAFPMIVNMSKLGSRVQAAGVKLSIDDLRLALMPLEETSKYVGRAFVPHMGADYQDMRDALGLLFKDIAPSDLSKRPLPKHLASIMSDVLDDTKWIGKASLRDRGRILSDDLGL